MGRMDVYRRSGLESEQKCYECASSEAATHFRTGMVTKEHEARTNSPFAGLLSLMPAKGFFKMMTGQLI